jgi:hypothetical protein
MEPGGMFGTPIIADRIGAISPDFHVVAINVNVTTAEEAPIIIS